jgi:2-succinyl-5-enolpyruvyl-6-hydroxy-3-cyclohexene-1-carboxylate synthase
MAIDFSNVNTVWASVFVETLHCLGLTTAIICPGSRSGPLATAFAKSDHIKAIPVLDERSASFFALGIARQSGQPVALVCTSGTAGANFYPAVIEAKESGVPLLIITADRPPELRHCNAGQAIDQQKLYGDFPSWYAELAMPSPDWGMLAYLRQTVIHAWTRMLWPVPGSVHLNIPFREPLAPTPEPDSSELTKLALQLAESEFFAAVEPYLRGTSETLPVNNSQISELIEVWQQCPTGIIIAGLAQPQMPKRYCQAIARLSQSLGWPVLAEGLSPVRNYADLNPYLITTYDLLLRNPALAQHLRPKMVIRIGEMPTSKELRLWLAATQPRQWVVDPRGYNLDPLHAQTTHLRLTIEQLAPVVPPSEPFLSIYLRQWHKAESQARQILDREMTGLDRPFEGKVAWLLSQTLPPQTPVFISSSTPVRDVESFWTPNNLELRPFFNRGANGIDGSLSTALGMAYRQQSSIMLTGDLALLHDTNGFLLQKQWVGHLTIVLINNNGGGIFEMLPIAQFDPPFEDFFATPQDIDFGKLCATYAVNYEQIQTWEQLQTSLNPLPVSGIRVLEVLTDRRADALWRRENLVKFAAQLGE